MWGAAVAPRLPEILSLPPLAHCCTHTTAASQGETQQPGIGWRCRGRGSCLAASDTRRLARWDGDGHGQPISAGSARACCFSARSCFLSAPWGLDGGRCMAVSCYSYSYSCPGPGPDQSLGCSRCFHSLSSHAPFDSLRSALSSALRHTPPIPARLELQLSSARPFLSLPRLASPLHTYTPTPTLPEEWASCCRCSPSTASSAAPLSARAALAADCADWPLPLVAPTRPSPPSPAGMRIPIREQLACLVLLASLIGLAVIAIATWVPLHVPLALPL